MRIDWSEIYFLWFRIGMKISRNSNEFRISLFKNAIVVDADFESFRTNEKRN